MMMIIPVLIPGLIIVAGVEELMQVATVADLNSTAPQAEGLIPQERSLVSKGSAYSSTF